MWGPEVYGTYYMLVYMPSLLSLHCWHTITIRSLFHEDQKLEKIAAEFEQ